MEPITLVIGSILMVLVPVYLALIRPWQLRWGATDDAPISEFEKITSKYPVFRLDTIK